MIDSHYHIIQTMPYVKSKAVPLPASEPEPTWSPAANPAVAELLDHLAQELAREYIQLMEEAAEDEGAADKTDQQGAQ